MDNFNTIQERIKKQRNAYEAAESDYYNSLQGWSLAQQGIVTGATKAPIPAEVEVKRGQCDKMLQALQTEIRALANEGPTQQLLEKVPANLPFLLMPVRLEARYVNIQHVVRNLKNGDAVDVSELTGTTSSRTAAAALVLRPFPTTEPGEDPYLTAGFETDEEGVMTYELPRILLTSSAVSQDPTLFEKWKPASGMHIKLLPDRKELRIRIYPDDIFLEGHERSLQPEERDAGMQFWKNVCGGKDPSEEWVQFSIDKTPARAAWIIRATRPQNFSEEQPLPQEPVFDANIPLKDGAYTRPLTTRLLPERFVVRLYKDGAFREFAGNPIPEPLTMGLDPAHDPFNKNNASGMAEDGAVIKTPPYLNWIHNFEEAEKQGLAVRIDLQEHPMYGEGVDKIIVVGAKLSADEEEGVRLLSEQLEDHLYTEEGICILPKGTPTNNFGKRKSAFQLRDHDARQYFRSAWEKAGNGALETDGQRLRKALGLKDGLRIPSDHCTDISEAALMNELLWPATFGYYLLQFFTPKLDEATRELTRQFFIRNVSGRGNLPVLRVNRQPYGIIPTTSFAHWQYSAQATGEEKLAAALWTNFLSKLDNHWQAMTQQVKTVRNVGGQGMDEDFFKMLGISPSSGALRWQWVSGPQMEQFFWDLYSGSFLTNDPDYKPDIFLSELTKINIDQTLFQSLAHSYGAAQQAVARTLLDGAVLSEERPLQKIAGKALNVLEWLMKGSVLDIWNNDLASIAAGDGPAESLAGSSVLAILARQAVLRAYLETGLQKAETIPGLWLLKAKDFEMMHLHTSPLTLDPANLLANNRLHQGFKPIIDHFKIGAQFTLELDRREYLKKLYSGNQTLADWLYTQKKTVEPLKGMMNALDHLSKVPTARLKRLLAEHLDLCSYRLDAWMLGLVNQRLNKQRQAKPHGIGIGAFGYLLNLKPVAAFSNIVVEEKPAYVPAAVENIEGVVIPVVHSTAAAGHGIDLSGKGWERTFLYIGDSPLPVLRLNTATGRVEAVQSAVNSDGFIHAPSTAHATAAAILRAGYLNHRSDEKTALVSLQLNSPRVRKALQLLEGMQQGAHISELLGYYFERLLHENNQDSFLYNLRAAFPLKRAQAAGEKTPSPMTTIDGMALLEARRANPGGWLMNVSGIYPTDHFMITQTVLKLEDYLDALGDLLLAESVYQTANGNTDRAAAALRLLSEGTQGVTPDFMHTPVKGSTITHRVGVVLTQPLSNTNWQGWRTSGGLRSLLCPGINYWLSRQLPLPERIAITVTLPDKRKSKIRLSEMNMDPIDLVYALPASFAQAEQSPLALYVQSAIHQKNGPKFLSAKEKLIVDLKDRSLHTDTELTIFEISGLVAALRKMIGECRPLSANDFLLPDKSAAANDRTDATRLNASMKKGILDNTAIAKIPQTLRDQASKLNTAIQQKQAESVLQPLASALMQTLLAAWQQGVETSGTGGIFYLEQESCAQLVQRALDTAAVLESSLGRARALMTAIPASLTGEPLFNSLQEAGASLFGGNIRLLPDVVLENAVEVETCYRNEALIENAGDDVIERWMREAVLVRHPLRVYRRSALLSEALSPEKIRAPFNVFQFPFFKDRKQAWAGEKMAEGTPPEQRPVVSLLLELPAAYDAGKMYAGLIIDEWPEWIPERTADTGVAFQYNQPNTEPPQTMLLAVSPVEGGNWKWEHLVGAVNDALDLSKKRLITPTNIRDSNTGLNHMLPAILLPFMVDNQQVPVANPLGAVS